MSIILIMPITKINKREILELRGENRNANRYKGLKVKSDNKKDINYGYGNDFNRWFGDRFRDRAKFLDFKRKTSKKINLTKKIIRNNWFIGEYYRPIQIPKERFSAYLEGFSKFYDYCKKKKIKCYIMPSPIREEVYWYDVLKKERPKEEYFLFTLNKYLIENGVQPVLTAYNEIMEAKKKDFDNLIYFKDDGHYTHYGQFVSYNYFMDFIAKDFPNIKRMTKDDYKIYKRKYSYNCAIANRCNDKIEPEYQKYEEEYWLWQHKDNKEPVGKYGTTYFYNAEKSYNNVYNREKRYDVRQNDLTYFYNKNGYNKNILIFSDSFGPALTEIFIAPTFKNSARSPGRITKEVMEERISDFEKIMNDKVDIVLFYTFIFKHEVANFK